MKRFIFLLASIILVIGLNAQTLEVNPKNGKYRITESNQQDGWQEAEASWDEKAEKYVDYFSQAKSNPDKFLVIDQEEVFIKMTGLFKELTLVNASGIQYKSHENHFAFVEREMPKEESSLSLLPALVAVLAMAILAGLLHKETVSKKNENFLIIIGIIALVVAAVTTFVAGLAAAETIASIVALIAFIDIVAMCVNKEKSYFIFFGVYCLVMAVYFLIMFGIMFSVV